MIRRSQVAAARLLVAAAEYQGKESELPETTRRLARLRFEDLPNDVDGNVAEVKPSPSVSREQRAKKFEEPRRYRLFAHTALTEKEPYRPLDRAVVVVASDQSAPPVQYAARPINVISAHPVDVEVNEILFGRVAKWAQSGDRDNRLSGASAKNKNEYTSPE